MVSGFDFDFDCLNEEGVAEETPPPIPVSQPSAIPSKAEGLPENWEAVTDETSGEVYYYNTMSLETSWDYPV